MKAAKHLSPEQETLRPRFEASTFRIGVNRFAADVQSRGYSSYCSCFHFISNIFVELSVSKLIVCSVFKAVLHTPLFHCRTVASTKFNCFGVLLSLMMPNVDCNRLSPRLN